jgi:hypothetical protein
MWASQQVAIRPSYRGDGAQVDLFIYFLLKKTRFYGKYFSGSSSLMKTVWSFTKKLVLFVYF